MRLARYPIAACLCWASLAFGQGAAIVPSDIDLRAAYCLATVRSQLSMTSNTLAELRGQPQSMPVVSAINSLSPRQSRLQIDARRLETYVLPKMITANELGYATAIDGAMRRSDEDWASMQTAAQACVSRCGANDASCSDSCMASEPAVRRLQQCTALDWLPF